MVPSPSINTLCVYVCACATINSSLMKWKRLTGIKGLSPKDDEAALVNTSSGSEGRGKEGEKMNGVEQNL